jgi:NDMA-dependent alcohol dehydrogenase
MSIATRAAVCFRTGDDWRVECIDLDPPRAGEVLVGMAAAGLCHSDESIRNGDQAGWPMPIVGGHEGAGIIEAVGPGVTTVKPGDHVVFAFIPACGRCLSCSTGRQNLCDLGMYMASGTQVSDHTSRHRFQGQDLNLVCMLGTFSERTVVNEANCVKIDDNIPLDIACLLGCGVITGWGASVNTGEVAVGDTVVVVGAGGIGANAIQGAAAAGARHVIAADPIEYKREKAREFGATHVVAIVHEALELVVSLTRGRLANVVVNTKGVGEGADIGDALRLVGKRGRVVVTNLHRTAESEVSMSALDLVTMEKQVRGSLFGSGNPRADIPRMLDLYLGGRLKLDELATHHYSLDEVNRGYDDMMQGRSVRGVIRMR